jgi:hypothetical protein
MGRGGYNGGGPSAIFPQTDPLYVFAGREEHLSSILDSERANIIRCGRDLENERGGVQSEFGYLPHSKLLDKLWPAAQGALITGYSVFATKHPASSCCHKIPQEHRLFSHLGCMSAC